MLCGCINEPIILEVNAEIGDLFKFSRDLLDLLSKLDFAIFDLPVGIVTSTVSGELLSANHEAVKLLGYSNSRELLSVKAQELYSNISDREEHIKKLNYESIKNKIYKINKKDTSTFWASLNSIKKEFLDTEVIITFFKNIDQEVENLARIADNEMLLSQMESVSDTGHYEWNLLTGEIRITSGFKKLIGTSKSDNELSAADIRKIYHVDDLETYINSMKRVTDNAEQVEFNARINTIFGEKHMRIFGSPAYNSLGNVEKVFVSFRDITDSVNRENSLKEKSSALEKALIKVSKMEKEWSKLFDDNQVATELSINSEITAVNRKYLELFNCKEDNIIGTQVINHIAPEEQTRVLKIIENRPVGDIDLPSYITKGITKDGRIFDLEIHATKYNMDETEVTMTFFHDITYRLKREVDLKNASNKLETSLLGTITSLGKALGAKDSYTFGHQESVSKISVLIADQLNLNSITIEGLKYGALIHDIGKISIPSEILSKPSKLSDLEYNLVKTHCESGYNLISDVEFPWDIKDMILHHHEKLDGSGYPDGLKGADISLESQIIGVADVFEAMSSHRPYRPALGIDAAIRELKEKAGTHYKEEIVSALEYIVKNKKDLIKSILNKE